MTEYRTIAEQNDAFDNLLPFQKRVLIARDVLAQIASGRIIPQQGVYLSATLPEHVDFDAEVCDVLAQVTSCKVCGIGGIFLSAVGFADKLKVSDLADTHVGNRINLDGDDARQYLQRFFTNEQLRTIEAAFEKWPDQKGGSFAPNVVDPTERLRLIMENIIVNRGHFDHTLAPYPVATIKWETPNFTGN